MCVLDKTSTDIFDILKNDNSFGDIIDYHVKTESNTNNIVIPLQMLNINEEQKIQDFLSKDIFPYYSQQVEIDLFFK